MMLGPPLENTPEMDFFLDLLNSLDLLDQRVQLLDYKMDSIVLGPIGVGLEFFNRPILYRTFCEVNDHLA